MYVRFFIYCYGVGLSAACAMGPIFVLTFNRSALFGFWKGFSTALGSAAADTIFFALGLLGALTLLENSNGLILAMDSIGAAALIGLGIRTIQRHRNYHATLPTDQGVILSALKSFLVTIVNPLVALSFMFISIQIVPEELNPLPISVGIIASSMVFLGSMTTLSMVSLIASKVGSAISKKKLSLIAYLSGFSFIAIAFYFIFDLISNLIRLFYP